MFKVENQKVFWNDRLAYGRDLIIPEDVLKEIEFEDIGNAWMQHVVWDGMLIYVLKYKEGSMADLWHFAFQSFDPKGYFYESKALYLGP